MLPAQSSSAPSGTRRLASSGGRSEYSITCGRPSTDDDHAQLLVGREPLNDLERDLRAGFQVQADERRLGDPHQGIIHLEIKERLARPASRISSRQLGPPTVGTGGQRGEGPAVPVRGKGEPILGGQQDACRSTDRWPASAPG